MVEHYRRRGSLSSLALAARARTASGDERVRIIERGPRGQLALRGDAASARFRAGVASALGVDLPTVPNTVANGARTSVLWLGPDEWLAVLEAGAESAALVALEAELAGMHALVSDVSHSRSVIALAGAASRDVLARGCSLDLDPRVFGPGRCAQSAFARAHVLLHQLDDQPTFDLHVHRSFAEYIWAWLVDAAEPFRPRVLGET